MAKFAAAGKTMQKKDLGLLANMYGHVYVARVAFGAKMSQTVQAFLEAEVYPGTSLIIAYSHCIAHGYDMANGATQQKLAVDSVCGRCIASTRAASPEASHRCISTMDRRLPSPNTCATSRGSVSWSAPIPSASKGSLKEAQEAARDVGVNRGVPAARGHHRATSRDDDRRSSVSDCAGTEGVTMDLSTEYLGLKLPHPLVAGAGPLADTLYYIKRLEDAGAAAIVLRSLFEEQITREQISEHINLDSHGESFAEAASYFPSPHAFALGPFDRPDHLRRAKATVRIPVMASLNGRQRQVDSGSHTPTRRIVLYALDCHFAVEGSGPDEGSARGDRYG